MEHLTAGDPGQVGELLAAGISAELAREAAARAPRALAVAAATATREGQEPAGVPAAGSVDPRAAASASWGPEPLPLLLLQPPRTGRDLLADHVTAMVCCSAVDTAGAAPGLDWLDGPALLIGGERRADLGVQVLSLVEEGDAKPLRSWLVSVGVRPEKPVRLG
jgi:hypothetical protein